MALPVQIDAGILRVAHLSFPMQTLNWCEPIKDGVRCEFSLPNGQLERMTLGNLTAAEVYRFAQEFWAGSKGRLRVDLRDFSFSFRSKVSSITFHQMELAALPFFQSALLAGKDEELERKVEIENEEDGTVSFTVISKVIDKSRQFTIETAGDTFFHLSDFLQRIGWELTTAKIREPSEEHIRVIGETIWDSRGRVFKGKKQKEEEESKRIPASPRANREILP